MADIRRVSPGLSRIMEIVDENSSNIPEGAYLEIGRLLMGENKMENGERVVHPMIEQREQPRNLTLMSKIEVITRFTSCKRHISKFIESGEGLNYVIDSLHSMRMDYMTGLYDWMPVDLKRSIEAVANMTEQCMYHNFEALATDGRGNIDRATVVYNTYMHHLGLLCKYIPSA